MSSDEVSCREKRVYFLRREYELLDELETQLKGTSDQHLADLIYQTKTAFGSDASDFMKCANAAFGRILPLQFGVAERSKIFFAHFLLQFNYGVGGRDSSAKRDDDAYWLGKAMNDLIGLKEYRLLNQLSIALVNSSNRFDQYYLDKELKGLSQSDQVRKILSPLTEERRKQWFKLISSVGIKVKIPSN